MGFSRISKIKSTSQKTGDPLPELQEYTIEEFKDLPDAVKRALLRKAAPDRG